MVSSRFHQAASGCKMHTNALRELYKDLSQRLLKILWHLLY